MRNKKVILSSILSLVLCLSLIVGGTFALFTSESKTNIAITSGKVEVVAWLDDIETSTFGTLQDEGTFELGGAATYDSASNKLTVDKIAPGDRVDFNVYVENKSNIDVSYRVKVAFAGELQDALVANITLPGDEAATVLTSADIATKWNKFETNQVILPMSVELPYGVGNEYQDQSAEIIVTVEAVQGNATELVMIENTRYATLADAIAAADDGQTIGLSGVFTLPTDGSLKNRALTFKSIEDSVAVFDMKDVATGQSTIGADLTFEGVEVIFGTENYMGIQHAAKITYKDCTIYGKQFMYAATVQFTNCEFVNYADYAVWTYGSSAATFTDCTFTTGGKAVLVYADGGKVDATHNFTNCTFNSNGQTAIDKAAVEVGAGCNSTYTLSFTNCTANGFAANNSTSPLWGNKNSMTADELKITVDGNSMNTTAPTVKDITTAEELKAVLAAGTAAESGNYVVNIEANIDLTNETWTPYTVDGYNGADVITINGNGHTVTGLSAPLFAGGFAGGSGIVINDLTIKDSTIVSTNTQGSGAFIECVDSMAVITLNNCHLLNSTVKGSRTGGLIGWTSGYNNTNDGAVKTYVTVENCSVIGCTIESTFSDEGTTAHTESVGAIFGHAGANPWTFTTIKNCTIKNNTILGGNGKTGVILGTANVGEVTITGCTMEGNTVNGSASAVVYGRTAFGGTGKLTVDGVAVN